MSSSSKKSKAKMKKKKSSGSKLHNVMPSNTAHHIIIDDIHDTFAYTRIISKSEEEPDFIKLHKEIVPIIEKTEYGYKTIKVDKHDDIVKKASAKSYNISNKFLITEHNTKIDTMKHQVVYSNKKLTIKKAVCCIFKGCTINAGSFTNCVFHNCVITGKHRFKFTKCYFKDKDLYLKSRGKLIECHFDNCDVVTESSTIEFIRTSFANKSLYCTTSTIIMRKCVNIAECTSFSNCTLTMEKCESRGRLLLTHCTINITHIEFGYGYGIMELLNCIGEITDCNAVLEELLVPFNIIGCSLKIDTFHVSSKSITLLPIFHIKSSMVQTDYISIEEWPETSLLIETSTVYFTNLEINSYKNILCTDSTVHVFDSIFHNVEGSGCDKSTKYSINAENSSIKLVKCRAKYPILLDNSSCSCIKYTGKDIKLVNNSTLKSLNASIKNIFIEEIMYDYEHIMIRNAKIVKSGNTVIKLDIALFS